MVVLLISAVLESKPTTLHILDKESTELHLQLPVICKKIYKSNTNNYSIFMNSQKKQSQRCLTSSTHVLHTLIVIRHGDILISHPTDNH